MARPGAGPVTTNDVGLMRQLALQGVGLLYTFEPQIEDDVRRGTLRVVLEPYAPEVPGFFVYFPSRAQVSTALRAFVEVARELLWGRHRGERDRDPALARYRL